MGNVDTTWIDHMGIGWIGVEIVKKSFQLSRVDPAVMGGQGQHLVAGVFDGPGFVDIDVACRGGNHALRAVEQPVDDDLVALRAADEKENVRIRVADGGADFFFCAKRIFIFAVTHLLDKVRFCQGLQ